jgi:uncharacterized GH25 family protein
MKKYYCMVCTLATLFITFESKAHVPFLKPNLFNVTHHRLQIESSFTEFPFQPDFAMDSPHFSMVSPSGTETRITTQAKTKAAVYLEPQLTEDGTYRISTGIKTGPKYKATEVNSKLYFAEDMLRFPGKPTAMQYYSRADTYIFKGNNKYEIRPSNKGLEIMPLASPNSLVVGGQLSFRVLQDGKSVPNARIILVAENEHFIRHRIGDLYDIDNNRESNLFADTKGEFTFHPKQAGLHFLFVTVHHKVDETLWESYNASLTLEVNLPIDQGK